MVNVKLIETESELQKAYKIRKKVFVEEQNVPESEEYDQYENICRHFIAYFNNAPAGTCRWRKTEKGIKMERFAVIKNYRGKKIGSALVSAALDDIKNHYPISQIIYLHAQLSAMCLYEKFGFKPVGEIFSECNIDHYKMELQNF